MERIRVAVNSVRDSHGGKGNREGSRRCVGSNFAHLAEKTRKNAFSHTLFSTIQLAFSTIRGGKMTVRLKCRKLRLNWFFLFVI